MTAALLLIFCALLGIVSQLSLIGDALKKIANEPARREEKKELEKCRRDRERDLKRLREGRP